MGGEFATLHCNRIGETRKIVLSSLCSGRRKTLICEGEHGITFLLTLLIDKILSDDKYKKVERAAMLKLIKDGIPTMKYICGELKNNS